jgi:hypothetical protein
MRKKTKSFAVMEKIDNIAEKTCVKTINFDPKLIWVVCMMAANIVLLGELIN